MLLSRRLVTAPRSCTLPGVTETTLVPRLAAIWQQRVGQRARRVAFAALLCAGVAAAHLGRVGTPTARLSAALAFVLVAGLVVARRVQRRRRLSSAEGVIQTVVRPVDAAIAQSALRAHALSLRAQNDSSVGSEELARLHFERVMARVSLDAVGRVATRRATRLAYVAFGLMALAFGAVVVEPMRVLEGFDVLAARRGMAPVPLSWLELLRVQVQPPAYLRQGEQALFAWGPSELPQGSVVTVRGRPVRLNRHLVLTDGQREVSFVDDGSGNSVARWTLDETANLRVAARFGQVLIPEAESLELHAIEDAVPVVLLEGAPRSVQLKDIQRLELGYAVSDDHGLRQIDLVLRSGSREERRVLLRPDAQSKLERGAHALDPRDAFLRRMFLPVMATIEARDNDVRSGKWGESAAITITPPAVGEPEALRLAAFQGVRDQMIDLLAQQLDTERSLKTSASAEQRVQRRRQEAEARKKALEALRQAVAASYAGVRVPSGLSAFALGQASALEKGRGDARRRTEDVLLAFDAGIRSLANRDAQQVSKRLGDVAEEVAEGAKQARNSEQQATGERRVHGALPVLDAGTRNLLALGALGADLGSVAEGEIRRIRRAYAAKSLFHAELAARHLAQRLRRPAPSFSSAGGGGVESGGGTPGPGEPSEADRQFDQLMREVEQLATEHGEHIRGVERTLSDAEQGEGSEDLKREAALRAERLRKRVDDLPRAGAEPGSARAAGALGREHLGAMAQNLERLALKEAVESGRGAQNALDEAARLAQDAASPPNWLDESALQGVRRELNEQLAWAQENLGRLQQQAQGRAAKDLADAARVEEALARRAGNLAGRGAHSDAKLPDDLQDALEKAESAMQQASRELSGGRGESGLELQREAQRLLERSSSGKTSEGDESGDQERSGEGPDAGRDMSSSGQVPPAEKARRAEEFRRRVLEGLSKERRGRLAPAVERYAEELLE